MMSQNPGPAMAGEDRPALTVRGVRKTFEAENAPVRALRGVNLTIGAGEFAALMGPSGCGKSTLLRIIAGLGSPSAGTIEWPTAPHSASGVPEPDLGFVFQDPTLMPWSNTLKNVMLPMTLAGVAIIGISAVSAVASWIRRRTARARATSSRGLNGLVT